MRGIEIMLMGILSAMQNGTNYTDNNPFETDGVLDVAKVAVGNRQQEAGQENAMPRKINVTSWQNMPYSGYIKRPDGVYEGIGYAFDMLRLIQSKLKFTYTIIPPKEEVLGDNTRGVIGQLYRNEVDLAVAFIPVLTTLQEFCSFSGSLDDIEISFMMKRPRGSAIGSGLLAPFNDTVWWCILGSLIIVGPVIFVIIHIRTKMTSRGHPEGFSLLTCVWFTYGALLKQGSTITPVTGTTRMLFATWWIFITILTSFYTANLTAFLTLSEFTLPFNTIEDITKKNQDWLSYKDHVIENTIGVEYKEELKPLNWSYLRHEGEFIKPMNNTAKEPNFVQVRSRIFRDKGPLFIGDKAFMQDLIFYDYRELTLDRVEELKRCRLVMQPANLYVNDRAFAYPRNSTISQHIDKQLRYLVETGIIKHMKKEALPGVEYCPLNLKSTERRLRNEDLTMTYYCVAVGFILATLTFLGEQVHRLMELRKGFDCGKCCSSLCCRSKIKSAELPIYKSDNRPKFLKPKPSPIMRSPYDGQMAKKHVINGRDYWVIRAEDGDRRLVPIRSPSAVLFSYTSYLDNPHVRDPPKISDNWFTRR